MHARHALVSFLEQQDVVYTCLPLPDEQAGTAAPAAAGVPLDRLVRGVLLARDGVAVLCVLPYAATLDRAALHSLWGKAAATAALAAAQSVTPLGALHDVETIVDQSLRHAEKVYLVDDTGNGLVMLEHAAFMHLQGKAEFHPVAIPIVALESQVFCAADRAAFELLDGIYTEAGGPQAVAAQGVLAQIGGLDTLPPMPEQAREILRLRNDPDASCADLAAVVSLDPALAAQVMRYARAPLFGYRGRVDCVEDAIVRVLGFDMVMNLALGICSGRALKVPADGPLGRKCHWRDAVYCAQLARALAAAAPRSLQIKPGLAYLAGLLHNFGYLVLGQVAPNAFAMLNDAYRACALLRSTQFERELLGISGHAIGARLMADWAMPMEVVDALSHQDDPDYRGNHHRYAYLLLLARASLPWVKGDTRLEAGAVEPLLQALGISKQRLAECRDGVLQQADDLARIASQLAA